MLPFAHRVQSRFEMSANKKVNGEASSQLMRYIQKSNVSEDMLARHLQNMQKMQCSQITVNTNSSQT